MSEFNITVEGGSSVRLPTAGKYCDRDIVVTAEGGTPTPTQEKTVEITANGTVYVAPDEGYALSKVTANVNVPIPEGYIKPNGELEVTENGTFDVTDKLSVNVNVPTGGGGSYNFEWARVYEIEIGANSIKNATDAIAYIKTLVDSYSTSLIILMSPLTVNNQLVLCGADVVMRCRGGKIANVTVAPSYDILIPEGTKYLVLEKQG